MTADRTLSTTKDPACQWCTASGNHGPCVAHRNGWGVVNETGWRGAPAAQQCCAWSKSRDGRCRLPANRGLIVCRRHGGNSPRALAGARRRAGKANAVLAVATYGLPVTSTPEQALLDELYRTVGHVQYLAGKVRELHPEQLKQLDTGGTFERASVWVEMYQAERQHLARVARDCISAGIEERQVRTLEAYATDIAALMRRYVDAIVEHFGLTADQREEANGIMLGELRAIEGGGG